MTWPRAATVTLWITAAGALSIVASEIGSGQEADHGAPFRLAARAAEALNRRRFEGFRALARPGADLEWVKSAVSAPDPMLRRWAAGTLLVERQPWVVLSLDKMVEMDHDHLYRAAAGGARLGQEIDEAEPGRHWRVVDHDERVSIDPDRRRAAFTDEFRVRRVREGDPFPLIFDLGLEYQIDSLSRAGSPLPWKRAGNLVLAGAPVRSGDVLHIAYHRVFTGPSSLLSNVQREDALLYADWLPVISYQPARSTITIEGPADWESIAQGELTATRRLPGNRIARTWTNPAPVSFIMAAAGRYTVTRYQASGYPLATYMLHFDREKSERGLRTLAAALPFYLAHFGPIPWKRYAIVETDALQGLAQEGYSYSVYSTSAFPGVCTHELGHSWWGGRVNNTYFGSYWNESLTTYSTDLVDAMRHGDRSAQLNRKTHSRHYRASLVGRPEAPLMQASRQSFGINTFGTTYSKGAMVCHMLRRELGDDVFFRTLRRFASEYAGRAAEWDDLARITSKESGRPMGWFFDQWTRRPGGLETHWEHVRVRPLAGGKTEVQAALVQDGTPFRARVTVEAQGSRGDARVTVPVTAARTAVRLVIPGVPRRLVADPDDDLLWAPGADERPPNPAEMCFDHHPLRIVFGTGGDAAYRAAMRRQAGQEQRFWEETSNAGFADLSEIRTVSDRELGDGDRRNDHLILIGRPGANSVLDEVSGRLPVRFERGGAVELGDTGRITGPDLVAVSYSRSPWNSSRLLTTWSGLTTAAMELPWEESDPSTRFITSAWVASHGRILGFRDAGVRDPRTYRFDSR